LKDKSNNVVRAVTRMDMTSILSKETKQHIEAEVKKCKADADYLKKLISSAEKEQLGELLSKLYNGNIDVKTKAVTRFIFAKQFAAMDKLKKSIADMEEAFVSFGTYSCYKEYSDDSGNFLTKTLVKHVTTAMNGGVEGDELADC
jgi:hypothetical protein